MRVREPYKLPPEQREKQKRAEKLEWATLGFLVTIVVIMYLTMGGSQAMKTAWIEDMLGFIPPLVFLASLRFHKKAPNEHFPYGYRRANLLAFLCAATALFAMGLYLFYDAATSLLSQEHPTIGTVTILSQQIWLGWLMIAALVYSAVPSLVLGRKKIPLARELHEKVLYADADMNKADWQTAVAAIIGILGIGLGWWWADAAAAGLISLSIIYDGFTNLKRSLAALMDQRPTEVDGDDEAPIVAKLRDQLQSLDWVAEADVRLREVGDVYSGEAYVVPHPHLNGDLVDKVREASRVADNCDWQIYDVVIMPVRSLRQEDID
ncbi:MAG TPA: cation diffusion facilitator family transporter [Anaerolineae bacterium]|nr:cation diffusion facilitator family transporter [Anaerolineae bacterium]